MIIGVIISISCYHDAYANVITQGQISLQSGTVTYNMNFTKLNMTSLAVNSTGIISQYSSSTPLRKYNFTSALTPSFNIQWTKINPYETDFNMLTSGITDLKGTVSSSTLSALSVDKASNPWKWVSPVNSFNATVGHFIQELWVLGPDAELLLHYHTIADTSVNLEWYAVNMHNQALQGYQINYTTPQGNPMTVIVNSTNSSGVSWTISNLIQNTPYSFRLGVWGNETGNFSGNILNTQTLTFTPFNYTAGNLTLGQTNSVLEPITFATSTPNSTTTDLMVTYPNTYNMSCNLGYQFAQNNRTYYNLPSTPIIGSNLETSTFTFRNATNDIITATCTDLKSNATNKYVLTQNSTQFPLIQQVDEFRAGVFGTHGNFGAIDFITLLVVIISMIGLNRVNETVGVVFSIAIVGALAYFHIIQFPTIIFAAIAVILVIVVTSTRKLAYS